MHSIFLGLNLTTNARLLCSGVLACYARVLTTNCEFKNKLDIRSEELAGDGL